MLDLAINDTVFLYSSLPLLDELAHTLNYPKFGKRLASYATTPAALVRQYAALAMVVTPATISRTVLRDADDDAVLACALAAQADYIVSGDAHLLNLKQYQFMSMTTTAEVLQKIAARIKALE